MVAFPRSFADPAYSALAATVEEKYGLPHGILDAIRLRGERSNADQVSSAQARTPYQFIPSTRQGFIEKYGIDPWSDPASATQAAALHLRDDYQRTGSWDEAIARYYGGQRPRSSAYKYQAKVGDFDNVDTSKPYYTGDNTMAPSLYPVVNGVDPLAPEVPQQPVPVAGPTPSVALPAASPATAKKRGGILGALESVFMPDPGSRWAGALRDGLTNAKESQQNYLEGEAARQLSLETANAKLKQMMKNGEFTVVGNNVFHTRPDGSYEMIEPPQTTTQNERLIDQWKALPNGDPAKQLIERLLLGSQSDEAQANARTVAGTRAGATVQAARIRGKATTIIPDIPHGWSVVK